MSGRKRKTLADYLLNTYQKTGLSRRRFLRRLGLQITGVGALLAAIAKPTKACCTGCNSACNTGCNSACNAGCNSCDADACDNDDVCVGSNICNFNTCYNGHTCTGYNETHCSESGNACGGGNMCDTNVCNFNICNNNDRCNTNTCLGINTCDTNTCTADDWCTLNTCFTSDTDCGWGDISCPIGNGCSWPG